MLAYLVRKLPTRDQFGALSLLKEETHEGVFVEDISKLLQYSTPSGKELAIEDKTLIMRN